VLCVRVFCIVISSSRCEDQPYRWVRREKGERERRRDDMLAKSEDKNCMLPY
jgi:hypothetical protein